MRHDLSQTNAHIIKLANVLPTPTGYIGRYNPFFFNCNVNFLNQAATLNIHISSRNGNPFRRAQTASYFSSLLRIHVMA